MTDPNRPRPPGPTVRPDPDPDLGWSDPEPEPWLPGPAETFEAPGPVSPPPVAEPQVAPSHVPHQAVVVEVHRGRRRRTAAWWRRLADRMGIWGAVATAIVVVHLATFAVAVYRSYFVLDDFVFNTQAADHPLIGSYLFRSYNGHIMPGAFMLVWFVTRLDPMSYATAATVLVLGQLAVDVAMLAMLREAFGRTRGVLVVFGLFVVSPLLLPAGIWYAAALNQMPMQVALLLALRAHLRYLRGGRSRDAVVTSAWIVFGLAFYEKSLVIVPLLVAVSLLWFASGRTWVRIRTTARRYWRTWCLQLLVIGLYLGFYLNHGHNAFAGKGATSDRFHVAHNLLLHTIVPGLLGGPWHYTALGVVTSIASPPGVPQWVALVVLAGIVAVSVLLVRSSWRAWALLAGWVALDTALVLYGRIGATLGLEPRDVTDLALVAALCTGLAFLPLAGDTVRSEAEPSRPRVLVYRALVRPFVPQLGAAVAGAMVLGSLISNSSLVGIWQANPAKAFINNARHDLAQLPAGTPLDDGAVPDDVVSALVYPESKPSNLFRPLAHRPSQLTVSSSLAILDSKGHVQAAVVSSGPQAVPGPAPQCGWQVGTTPVQIPLSHDLDSGQWTMQITYVASAEAQAVVTAGRTTRVVNFASGNNDVFVAIEGRVDNIGVALSAAGEPVCISAIAVGVAHPVGGS